MIKLNKVKATVVVGISALALLGAGGFINHNAYASNITARDVYIMHNNISNLNVYASNVHRSGGSAVRNNGTNSNNPRHYHHTATKSHPTTNSTWHLGIPNKLSSVNGWISNSYYRGYKNRSLHYVRYTTPLYSGSVSEGVNFRPHYYTYKSQYMGNQSNYGNVLSTNKDAQVRPYYRYLGHNTYNIISGNNFKNGLQDDLNMYRHPKATTYYTPSYVTVKYFNYNNLDIWRGKTFMGRYHRMTTKVAEQLGY